MREPILYRIVRPIITLLFKAVYRPKIVGIENIPGNGAVVLAGNHTNNFDSFLLVSSNKRTIHFLAKHKLFEGWKKIIFSNIGAIPVDRTKSKNPEVIEHAIKVLDDKRIIGIFPEGTINRAALNPTLPFKTGAVRMASQTDAVIVPFVISGIYRKFRRGIRIDFLTPYTPSNNIDEENRKLQNIISNEIVLKQEEK